MKRRIAWVRRRKLGSRPMEGPAPAGADAAATAAIEKSAVAATKAPAVSYTAVAITRTEAAGYAPYFNRTFAYEIYYYGIYFYEIYFYGSILL
jgi:hypothetical protein